MVFDLLLTCITTFESDGNDNDVDQMFNCASMSR